MGPGDVGACQRLLRAVYGADRTSRDYVPWARATATGAWAGRRLVGTAAVFANPMHPAAVRAAVVVHPDWRRQGLGTDLWAAASPHTSAAVTSLWATQVGGRAFAARHGFVAIRETYSTSVAVHGACRRYAALPGALKGYRLEPLRLLAGPAHQHLIRLVQRTYELSHRDNPVAPRSLEDWRRLTFAEDLDLDASLAVWRDRDLAAFALIHRSARRGHVELGWLGTAPPYAAQSRGILQAVVGAQLCALASRGFHHLDLEADSTDPANWPLLDAFPFAPAPAWLTLRRPAP